LAYLSENSLISNPSPYLDHRQLNIVHMMCHEHKNKRIAVGKLCCLSLFRSTIHTLMNIGELSTNQYDVSIGGRGYSDTSSDVLVCKEVLDTMNIKTKSKSVIVLW